VYPGSLHGITSQARSKVITAAADGFSLKRIITKYQQLIFALLGKAEL
jgi:hypothetical protein